MHRLFNVVMRIVNNLLGVGMLCLGFVWILQGLNIAFRVGFMVGDKQWVLWGAILALVGLAEIVWANQSRA